MYLTQSNFGRTSPIKQDGPPQGVSRNHTIDDEDFYPNQW